MNIQNFEKSLSPLGFVAIQSERKAPEASGFWFVLGQNGNDGWWNSGSKSEIFVKNIEITGHSQSFFRGSAVEVKVTFTNNRTNSPEITKKAWMYMDKKVTFENVTEYLKNIA
jgi:hypothetical protein